MSELNIIEQQPGHFLIEGPLTFASIDKKTLKSSHFVCPTVDRTRIDLQKVTAVDSAGLALMIEWIKQSKRNNKQLSFMHIPQQLLALAKLSGFDPNDYLTGDAGDPAKSSI